MPKNFNKYKNHALKLRDFLLDLVFPIECFGCGQEGKWICQKCFRKLEIKTKHSCLNCKKETNIGEFCPDCRANFFLDGIIIAGDYQNKILAKAIKSLKYKFAKDIAKDLGEFLNLSFHNTINQSKIYHTQLIDVDKTILMPVPLHPKRLKWRGFNQSELLSKEISKAFNLNVNFNLACVKKKKPQAKLSAADRKKNIQGCFKWQGDNLNGKDILLIDDVVTTGATLNECAKILKKAGADKIWGLVIANG